MGTELSPTDTPHHPLSSISTLLPGTAKSAMCPQQSVPCRHLARLFPLPGFRGNSLANCSPLPPPHECQLRYHLLQGRVPRNTKTLELGRTHSRAPTAAAIALNPRADSWSCPADPPSLQLFVRKVSLPSSPWLMDEKKRPREVQPPTPAQPAREHSTTAFQHRCPGVTTPSRQTPLRERTGAA